MVDFITSILLTVIASGSPISELRGGIPLGLSLGLDPSIVIPLAIIVNILIFFPIYFGLELLYEKFFSRYAFCRNIVERVSKKGKKYVEKYGVLGLAIFIAVPFPATGAWTGTLIAWLMRLDWKKSFVAVVLGVLIAGAIISAISLGALAGLEFLLG